MKKRMVIKAEGDVRDVRPNGRLHFSQIPFKLIHSPDSNGHFNFVRFFSIIFQ